MTDADSQEYFQSPDWYHATTLTERIGPTQKTRLGPRGEINSDLAAQRLHDWRLQAPFDTDSFFAQRLTTTGITEDELLHILGEPAGAIRDRFPTTPSWLRQLANAFSQHPAPDSTSIPNTTDKISAARFLGLVEPLIRQSQFHLRERIRTLTRARAFIPFDSDRVVDLLFPGLLSQLTLILGRTMTLELNVARLRKVLSGDTPEKRFESFLELIQRHDVAIALLREYPVMARQLVLAANNWLNVSLEFLDRLCTDWPAVCSTFSPEADPGQLVELISNVGDSHRGGRTVVIAKFASGFDVVYKPRSLAVDLHFQELLSWLNRRGAQPPFRTLRLLDRGDYGWVEFIETRGCDTLEEVKRFYERQGGYLALLYALEAIDFHLENLIAWGEHPVMVDLESLFHPPAEITNLTQSEMLANTILSSSTVRVGLLPLRLWSDDDYEGIDLSGFGAADGQLSPRDIPYWEDSGTDQMRLKRKRMVIPGGNNRPRLNGEDVDVLDYTETITAGFSNTYRMLMEYRSELYAVDGPLTRFADDEVRVIFRPTRTYAKMLQESFHPDLLRDALDRDLFFDRLWVEVEHQPSLAKVISSECADLWNLSVPRFTTRPSTCDLWTSTGERIKDYFSESGEDLVRNRLDQLSEQDLEQQLWFIRASLAGLVMGMEHARWPTYDITEPTASATSERLLAAACTVGDRIETLALRGSDDATWIGLAFHKERNWTLAPLGYDLYGGTAGIALFLAYLGAIARRERYTELARAALATMRQQMERPKPVITSIGGFGGWGGLIYTLTHLGALWDEPELVSAAENIVERLPSLVEQDEEFDVIGGSAGCIGSLVSLYSLVPSDRTLAVAIQCGDRLVACARPMKRGLGWETSFGETEPLPGFSHGAAGIAWALLELSALSGEERFRTAARAGIEYERSLYSPEIGSWLDAYEDKRINRIANDGKKSVVSTWCHGAPGIGLARLRCLDHLPEPTIRDEIETALKITLSNGFGLNHSLCHGDLGNLELLLQASLVLDESQWRHQTNLYSSIILDSIDQQGWLCGVPLGVETPGLMTGLAGIGYQLLRVAYPADVPSVLVLAPPKQQGIK